MQMVLVASEGSLDAALKRRNRKCSDAQGCCVEKCDGLEFQGLNKETRTVYYHVMHSNNCFYGDSIAEGSEYQISLRTRPSYFDQVAVVATEKSRGNANVESCTQAKFDPSCHRLEGHHYILPILKLFLQLFTLLLLAADFTADKAVLLYFSQIAGCLFFKRRGLLQPSPGDPGLISPSAKAKAKGCSAKGRSKLLLSSDNILYLDFFLSEHVTVWEFASYIF